MVRELLSASDEETRALGRRLGPASAVGDLIGLYGPLGAGKTTLVRGLAEGLGIPPEHVRSPSFTLVVTYRGGRLPLHHIDLFRTELTPDDRLALREYLYGDGVCVVEWFDRFGEAAEHLRIDLAYGNTDERRIHLESCGDRYLRLVNSIG